MLRIGQRCIVSFPNFAHRALREQLYSQGRAPRAGELLGHAWYDTPNVRFLSLIDFEEFCRERGINIEHRVALDTSTGRQVVQDPNLNADVAVFVIARNGRASF